MQLIVVLLYVAAALYQAWRMPPRPLDPLVDVMWGAVLAGLRDEVMLVVVLIAYLGCSVARYRLRQEQPVPPCTSVRMRARSRG